MTLRIACLLVLGGCAAEGSTAERSADTSPPVGIDPGAVVRTQTHPWQGEVLFEESFDDARLEDRGWYDLPGPPSISAATHAPGSAAALECRFEPGGTGCVPRTTMRRLFDGVDELFVRYHVRYSDGWQGSGRPYHPHELYFLTDADDRWAGPSYTHLTIYVEQVDLIPRVGLQDAANVDPRCILRNDDSTVGCNGGGIRDFDFGENRSVAACNGLVGPVALRDCYALGGDQWYSSRTWPAADARLGTATGNGGWHRVEAYVALNSVRDGRGIPDGAIRLWVDGDLAVSVDSVLFRTAEHADTKINQVLFAPYIGDGSPSAQTMWIDQLTVARGRRP